MMYSLPRFTLLLLLILSGCGSPNHPGNSKTPTDNEFTAEEQELLEEMRETNILEWTPEMQLLGYRNAEHINPVRFLHASEEPFPLETSEQQIEEVLYLYNSGVRDLDYYLENMNVAGLMVIKDGKVVLEYYGYGNEPSTGWISFSITKSVLSMLFGVAISEGYINSVEDEVTRYLPELAGSSYDGVTIEQVLWMASGVAWNEDYTDPESDVAALSRIHSEEELIRYMAGLPRQAEPGTEFNYNTGETNLAGALLKAATGRELTDYANEHIWQGFGMEHDANWTLMGEGEIEHGGCCISASLRDYGRLGLMALNNGTNAAGRQLLPEDWMQQSTSPSPAYDGYGYFWWLHQSSNFSAIGIYGQRIFINPEHDIVIALHGKWEDATGPEYNEHRAAFIEGLTEATLSLGVETCCSEGNQ